MSASLSALGERRMGKSSAIQARLFETSVALEIVRSERDHLHDQVALLRDQLDRTTQRAERAEERLHQITLMMGNLGTQAIASQQRSGATEVLMDGRSVLRLNNPITAGHIVGS